jgi:hemolysin activation/secretion protein
MRPTLALRAGGKRVFGLYPFQDAAFIGGSDTLRGLRPQRYAGEGSVYVSTELRVRLGRIRILLPSEIGILGLFDVGRVFVKGESSDLWHHGVGGGLWVAILKPENTVSLAFAHSEGDTRVYFRAGVGF